MSDSVSDVVEARPMTNAELEIQAQQRNAATPSPEPRSGGMKAIVEHVKRELDSFKGDQPQSDNGSVSEEPSTRPSDDAEEKPETFTSKKAQDWKKLKSELANQRLTASEYKSKYEQLIRGNNGDSELEKIKSERDQYAARLEQLALERHPQFQSRFEARLNESIESAAKELGGKSPVHELKRLFELPAGAQRDAVLSEVRRLAGSAIAAGRFDAAVASFDRTRAERDRALAQSKENLERAEQLQALEHQRASQMQTAQREQGIQRALQLAQRYPSFKRNGDSRHDSVVDENQAMLTKYLRGELPQEQMALMPIITAEAKAIMTEVLPALQKENGELKQAIRELRYTQASVSGGTRRGDSAEPPRPKSFVEATMEQFREGGLLRD